MADETVAELGKSLSPLVTLLNLMSPADGAASVTPHNTTALAVTSRALWVGGAGDLVLTMKNGDNVTLVGVPAGTLLPVRVTHVKTATTATNIVNIY